MPDPTESRDSNRRWSLPPGGRRGRFAGLGAVVTTFRDVLQTTRQRLGWWSVPLVVFLLILAVVLLVIAVVQPLAPFLYPLF